MKIKINLQNILLGAGIALLPVYVFSSGGMQPTHIILAILIFYKIILYGFNESKFIRIYFFMTAYFMVTELIHSIIQSTAISLINPIFFIYNFLLVETVLNHTKRNGLGAIKIPIFIACIIAMFSVIVTGVDLRSIENGRTSGTFNNPNQLGFFSTCLLSISYLMYRHDYLKYWQTTLLYASSLLLSILSLSKAAMIANMFVLFILFIPKNKINIYKYLFISTLIIIAFFYKFISSDHLGEFIFFQRLLNMADETDSSLESRGYFVFIEANALEIIFGMGNENVQKILGHEVHSTFSSILHNYGIIGLAGFLSIIWIWGSRIYLAYGLIGFIALLGPSLLYGITHNGSRFTIFWLLVSTSLAMAQKTLKQRKACR